MENIYNRINKRFILIMLQTINKSKISLIHLAKNKLGLSDENYRSILSGLGVSSSKDLTAVGFMHLMDAFKKLGFKSMSFKEKKYYKHESDKNQVWGCSPAEQKFIESLWYEKARVKTNDALESFIFRIVKKSSAFLNKQDVEKIINALKHLK
jgi:hypothetical protein